MGWLTLTGETDTDITAGSLRAPHACWDKESNINHESQTLKYKRLTIKNYHGGDPERHWMVVIVHMRLYESGKSQSQSSYFMHEKSIYILVSHTQIPRGQ